MAKKKKVNKKSLIAGFAVFATGAAAMGANNASALYEYDPLKFSHGFGIVTYNTDFKCVKYGNEMIYQALSENGAKAINGSKEDLGATCTEAVNAHDSSSNHLHLVKDKDGGDVDTGDFNEASLSLGTQTATVIKNSSAGLYVKVLPTDNSTIDFNGYRYDLGNVEYIGGENSTYGTLNVEGNGNIRMPYNLIYGTMNINGGPGAQYAIFAQVYDNGALNITGNARYTSIQNDGFVFTGNAGSSITIDGGTFEKNNPIAMNSQSSLISTYGDLTINGGTFIRRFTDNYKVNNETFKGFWNEPWGLINVQSNGTKSGSVTVNGGSFSSYQPDGVSPAGTLFSARNSSENEKNNGAEPTTIEINGGTFKARNMFLSAKSDNGVIHLNDGRIDVEKMYYIDNQFITAEAVEGGKFYADEAKTREIVGFSNLPAKKQFVGVDEETGKRLYQVSAGVNAGHSGGGAINMYNVRNSGTYTGTLEEEIKPDDKTIIGTVAIVKGQTITIPCKKDNLCTEGEWFTLSDNENIVTVTNTQITGVENGVTDVIVTDLNDNRYVYHVTVTDVPVSQLSMKAGETKTAPGTEHNGLLRQTGTWTTSDSGVCTVDKGIITAVAAGECLVRVVDANTGAIFAWEVTVTAADPVENSEELSMKVGDTADKSAEGMTSESSTNTDVCTVENGIITAVGAGSCTVTITTPTVINTYKITVTLPVVEGDDEEATKITVKVGETKDLYCADGSKDCVKPNITAGNSDNEKVCTYKDGKVTGVVAGTCKITVAISTDEGAKEEVFAVTVKEDDSNKDKDTDKDKDAGKDKDSDKKDKGEKNPNTIDHGQAIGFTVAGGLLAALGVSFVKIRKLFGR